MKNEIPVVITEKDRRMLHQVAETLLLLAVITNLFVVFIATVNLYVKTVARVEHHRNKETAMAFPLVGKKICPSWSIHTKRHAEISIAVYLYLWYLRCVYKRICFPFSYRPVHPSIRVVAYYPSRYINTVFHETF